ncbi:MAG: type II toxin-antitoxin system YafQ family toxin [Oscillospiraceae bacterium]|nr:type II toxin-antitoxin system YafQ family toxin [Oscillospiraceae bacterium]
MIKYSIKMTSQFKRELKLAKKRGCDIKLLESVIKMIAAGDKTEELIRMYNDHALNGNWKSHRELHIEPDWLLIYRLYEDVLVLSLVRTGSHSDLFGK